MRSTPDNDTAMDAAMASATLWEKVRKGDYAAFETIYREMWEPLYLFAYRRLKDKSDAEDVVQHVFIKLWENRQSREIRSSLSGYLYTAVRYEVIDRLTEMLSQPEKISHIQEHILPVFNDIIDKLQARDMEEEIEGYIDGMPRQRLTIFRMSREEDLSATEIAERLNISEKTVRNQLSSAITQLRHVVKASFIFLLMHR